MRWSGGQIGHFVTIYFSVRMEGQLGAPFHFAVEFLVLVVALGGAFDALRARRDGAGKWAQFRNVTIPITGPPGGSYQATLVLIVETTHPKWVVGLTIAPTAR